MSSRQILTRKNFVALAALVMSLAACGGGAEDLAAETPTAADPIPTTEPEQESESRPAEESESESESGTVGAISVEFADCSYLDEEFSAADRLNNWRIARDEFLGIPHETTTDARLEQRSLVEISSDFGYSEATLVNAAEVLHTECFNRLVESGELTQQQADARVARSVESFSSLMHSIPDGDGRGEGTREDQDAGA